VFDKSARDDGTFSREDFAYNQEADIYLCPGGKVLTSAGTLVNDGATLLYRAKKRDCDAIGAAGSRISFASFRRFWTVAARRNSS
jgi:hypothetical protein